MRIRSKAKVLLVEDDKLIQRIMGSRLRQLGCWVEIVSTGRDALLHYRDGFELIFLDIGLPDMTGIDVCKEIRRDARNAELPIIVTTTWDASKEACLDAGVDDFILKPVSRLTLKLLLEKWFL